MNAVQQKGGKYQAAPESLVLKTLLATSVMAGGEQGGRKTEEPLCEHTPSPRSSLLQLVPALDSSTDD